MRLVRRPLAVFGVMIITINSAVLFPSQAYVNTVAGCCLAMGLCYAGTCDQKAYQCLVSGAVSHDII